MVRDDRNFYEIQLDNKQLIFIFLVAIVICAVFFLIGVKVGMNSKELQYSLANTNQSNEIKTTNLTSKTSENEQVAKQPENFSFHQLSEETPQESTVKPQTTKPTETKTTPKETTNETRPVRTPPTTSVSTSKQEPTTGVRYSIQVMSTSFRDKALAMRDNLKAKNYPAFVRQVTDDQGNLIYKVRVGSFPDRTKANDMLQKLKMQENITDAWIAQDTP